MKSKRFRVLAAVSLCSLGLFLGKGEAADNTIYQQLVDKLKDKGVITDAERSDLLTNAPAKQESSNIPKIKFYGYVQARYTATQNDPRVEQTDKQIDHNKARSKATQDPTFQDKYLTDRYSDVDGFSVRRADLGATGEVIPNVSFNLVGEFSTAGDYTGQSNYKTASGNTFTMKDAFVYYTYLPYASIKAGQFLVPFSRERLTPDPELLTPNRSLVVNLLNPDRDLGIQLDGKLADGAVKYALDAYNGAGKNTSKSNAIKNFDGLAWAGRLVLGTPKDFKVGDNPLRFSVGGNYLNNPNVANGYKQIDDTTTYTLIHSRDITDSKSTQFDGTERAYGVDTEFDFLGFNLLAEYLRADLEWRGDVFDKLDLDTAPHSKTDSNVIPHLEKRTSKSGWFVQGAYSLQQWLPEVPLQFVAKYEVYNADNHNVHFDYNVVTKKGGKTTITKQKGFDPNNENRNHDKRWTTLGVNYYLKGNDVKLSADYIIKNEDGNSIRDNTFLVQAQIKF